MTPTTILALVQPLTAHRGDKLDLTTMLLLRVQKFCKEKHWPWRKQFGTFNSVIGTQSYDLTATAGGSRTDFEQMIRLRRYTSATDIVNLDPVTDPEAQSDILENTTQDAPSSYFVDEATSILYFNCPPNAVAKYRYQYWACPTATLTSTIPLIPARLHFVLVDGLKMDVNEFLFGTESQKYIASATEYQRSLALAIAEGDFASNLSRQFASNDAIQSTS